MLKHHLYVKTNPDRRIGNHLFYGGVPQPFQKLQTIQQGKPERVSREIETLSSESATKTELSVGERMGEKAFEQGGSLLNAVL